MKKLLLCLAFIATTQNSAAREQSQEWKFLKTLLENNKSLPLETVFPMRPEEYLLKGMCFHVYDARWHDTTTIKWEFPKPEPPKPCVVDAGPLLPNAEPYCPPTYPPPKPYIGTIYTSYGAIYNKSIKYKALEHEGTKYLFISYSRGLDICYYPID